MGLIMHHKIRFKSIVEDLLYNQSGRLAQVMKIISFFVKDNKYLFFSCIYRYKIICSIVNYNRSLWKYLRSE